jgi:pyruvate kinase
MRRRRRTKILATLGPASLAPGMLEKLILAGADAFRINMSHNTSKTDMLATVAAIRAMEKKLGRPLSILADLQGPKLRIGAIEGDSIPLKAGDKLIFDQENTAGTMARIPLPHPEIFASVQKGHRLLLDDGRLILDITQQDDNRIECVVVAGNKISSRKGISLPDTLLSLSAMTPKDRFDLEAALEAGVDWVALSFVQRPEDVLEIKKIVQGRALIMSKIEKPQAVQRLEDILEMSDALMVARGDLGVEMPLERVPGIQKRITRMARRHGKPVVVATQMLESMISAPVPTRAEVSDVATAFFDGADAIMLSAESAVGDYPVEAVAMMNSIAEEVERDPIYSSIINAQRQTPEPTGADAIGAAARTITETLSLSAMVAWTSSGATALRVARERPFAPILALTPRPEVARRLALVWGVHAVLTEDAHDENDMVDRACAIAREEEFARIGERITIIAGMPVGTPGATNMVRLATIQD